MQKILQNDKQTNNNKIKKQTNLKHVRIDSLKANGLFWFAKNVHGSEKKKSSCWLNEVWDVHTFQMGCVSEQ